MLLVEGLEALSTIAAFKKWGWTIQKKKKTEIGRTLISFLEQKTRIKKKTHQTKNLF